MTVFEQKVTLEELMIEVLIEENYLRRYQQIRLSEISLMPTEADIGSGEIDRPSIIQNVGQEEYLDCKDMCIREFDRLMQIEITRVKSQLESQIALSSPIFGEETGEFVDITKHNECTAKL